jgi:hypothetical protein
MPLPGRDKTFALENCRDLLNKLEREIERFQAAHDDDNVTTMADVAFNASVTAWHLCDWVFGDLTEDQRNNLKLQNLEDLQKIARDNRALHICRQIATASKHWKISQHPDPSVSTTVTANPDWNIYIEIGGERLEVVHVFDDALTFWTHLIYHNGIAANLASPG